MVLGTFGLGPKHHFGFVQPDGRKMRELAKLLLEGKLKPIIDKTFLLEEAV